MNFCSPLISAPLYFNENHPGILVIENPPAFTQTIQALQVLESGNFSEYGFYEDGEPVKTEKRMELFLSPLQCELNQKKMISALHNLLSRKMLDGEHFQKTNQLNSILQQYWEELFQEIEYPITYSQSPEGTALLKACDIRLEEEDASLVEQVENYICASMEFLKKDIFVFVNLSSYLTEEELKLLYKSAAYKKCMIFCLESSYPYSVADESILLLDKDLCQLNLGWQN